MAQGQQQNRPVTPFEFTVTTLNGIPAALDATADLANGVLVEGFYDNAGVGYATVGGTAGVGMTVSVTINGALEPTMAIITAGTGYVDAETITLAENVDFSSLATGTLTSAVDEIVGSAATTTNITDGGTGWVTGDVIGAGETESDLLGSGLTGTVTASALVGDTPETGGVISAITITAGGTGYVTGNAETITYIGTGEVGISDTRYSDHDQYELGGDQYEYTETDDGQFKSTYTPLERAESLGLGTNVGDPSNTADTGQRFTDNASSVKLVLKADQPQWIVQQRDIDGGAITVFAEPGIVDRNGYLVGQDARAEDCVDEFRCQANGFFWNPGTDNTGDGGQGEYGYCQDKPVTFDPVALGSTDDQNGCDAISGGTVADYVTGGGLCTIVAAADADCPVGFKFDAGTSCVAYTAAEVNALTQSATVIKQDECTASGNHWESSESGVNTQCLDGATAGTFSFATFVDTVTGDHYNTTGTERDYARTTCKQFGFDWVEYNGAGALTQECQSNAVVAGDDQATCEGKGHVFIAGTCYDGADFGDGHNQKSSFQQDPNQQPK